MKLSRFVIAMLALGSVILERVDSDAVLANATLVPLLGNILLVAFTVITFLSAWVDLQRPRRIHPVAVG